MPSSSAMFVSNVLCLIIILWISADIVDVNKFTTIQSLLLTLPDEIRPTERSVQRSYRNSEARRTGLAYDATWKYGKPGLDCSAAEDFERGSRHCCLLLACWLRFGGVEVLLATGFFSDGVVDQASAGDVISFLIFVLWRGTPLTRVLGSRLKAYNPLQPPLIFLILSMNCRASPALSTLLTRTYLSANVVVL